MGMGMGGLQTGPHSAGPASPEGAPTLVAMAFTTERALQEIMGWARAMPDFTTTFLGRAVPGGELGFRPGATPGPGPG